MQQSSSLPHKGKRNLEILVVGLVLTVLAVGGIATWSAVNGAGSSDTRSQASVTTTPSITIEPSAQKVFQGNQYDIYVNALSGQSLVSGVEVNLGLNVVPAPVINVPAPTTVPKGTTPSTPPTGPITVQNSAGAPVPVPGTPQPPKPSASPVGTGTITLLSQTGLLLTTNLTSQQVKFVAGPLQSAQTPCPVGKLCAQVVKPGLVLHFTAHTVTAGSTVLQGKVKIATLTLFSNFSVGKVISPTVIPFPSPTTLPKVPQTLTANSSPTQPQPTLVPIPTKQPVPTSVPNPTSVPVPSRLPIPSPIGNPPRPTPVPSPAMVPVAYLNGYAIRGFISTGTGLPKGLPEVLLAAFGDLNLVPSPVPSKQPLPTTKPVTTTPTMVPTPVKSVPPTTIPTTGGVQAF